MTRTLKRRHRQKQRPKVSKKYQRGGGRVYDFLNRDINVAQKITGFFSELKNPFTRKATMAEKFQSGVSTAASKIVSAPRQFAVGVTSKYGRRGGTKKQKRKN
jgi:hypothetical protein